MRGIFIPDCTQEEIAEILMYARIGANNSMIGVHKHYISVEDTELPRWIPVSERLPEQSGFYITTCRDICENRVHTVGFDVVRKKWGRGGVIAWQPLPEPYKEGEEE